MCNEHFHGWDIEAVLDVLATIGYEGVDLTPWTVTDDLPRPPQETIERVRTAALSVGIDVIGIPRVFRADDPYHLAHPDPEVRARTLEYLRETVSLCGALGGRTVVFGSPNQRDVRAVDGMTHDRVRDAAVELFGDGELLERLVDEDVTLCMEPLSSPHTDFITTTREAIDFVERVDHPRVGVALDGYHLAAEDDPPARNIRRAGSHLAHFHADNTRGIGPADGSVDFGPIADALEDVGYDGFVSIELHADLFDELDDDPERIAVRSLEYLTRTFGS